MLPRHVTWKFLEMLQRKGYYLDIRPNRRKMLHILFFLKSSLHSALPTPYSTLHGLQFFFLHSEFFLLAQLLHLYRGALVKIPCWQHCWLLRARAWRHSGTLCRFCRWNHIENLLKEFLFKGFLILQHHVFGTNLNIFSGNKTHCPSQILETKQGSLQDLSVRVRPLEQPLQKLLLQGPVEQLYLLWPPPYWSK